MKAGGGHCIYEVVCSFIAPFNVRILSPPFLLLPFSHPLTSQFSSAHIYNLAADMGGMGFIESNQSVLTFNNTSISMNMLEGARRAKSTHFFYASSACVYNEAKQEDPANPGLVEGDAWPARPQDMYGLEKLYSEEMALAYGKDFGINVRIARFHNIYGPRGTWKGGREKAPAAFCRKAITSTTEFEMWGDGLQVRGRGGGRKGKKTGGGKRRRGGCGGTSTGECSKRLAPEFS